MRKKQNQNRTMLIIIIALLILIALGSIWLLHGIIKENKAEQIELEIKQEKMQAKKEAEDARKLQEYQIADHVYSHRGAPYEEIEHTFASYDKAISYGSHNIEQDLVISADGTLYVSHELTTDRLTGNSGTFSTMSDTQIDQLTTSDGQKILKLCEVFDKYKTSVTYIIELKSNDSRAIESFRKTVDRYHMESNIVVQCFELEVLKQLESCYPEMPKLHLSKDQWSFENAMGKDYVDILSVDKCMMTEANCKAAHASGKLFSVWTLNSESEIRLAINMGVDTYFTDDTNLAISLEKKYRDEEEYQKEKKERSENSKNEN